MTLVSQLHNHGSLKINVPNQRSHVAEDYVESEKEEIAKTNMFEKMIAPKCIF